MMLAWLLTRATDSVRTRFQSLPLGPTTWSWRSASTLTTVLLWSLLEIIGATVVLAVCWLVFASPWATAIWWALRPSMYR
jgi:hypothetical protein